MFIYLNAWDNCNPAIRNTYEFSWTVEYLDVFTGSLKYA